MLRGALVGASLLLCLCAPAAGAAITVNTLADETTANDGTCSLREAIATVEGGSSPDCPGVAASGTTTILLAGGTYRLIPQSELYVVDANVLLQGPSDDPAQAVIDAGDDAAHPGRVLEVGPAAQLDLRGLTITGGNTSPGAAGAAGSGGPGGSGVPGGGIENEATLTLDHVAVTDNRTGDGGTGGTAAAGQGGTGGSGGSGAGIDNSGVLTVSHSTIAANTTGMGGSGGAGGPPLSQGGSGGTGGVGGAIASTGVVTLINTTVSGNAAGTGGPTVGFFHGLAGTGGAGGGISSTGDLTVQSSTIAENSGGAGGSAAPGGGGGAINSSGIGTLSLTASTLNGNTAGPGGAGSVQSPNGGTGGVGGGVLDSSATAALMNDTIAGNAAGAGGAGWSAIVSGNGGSGGAAGGGGGIEYDNPGAMTLRAVTLSQNAVGRPGAGGAGIGAGAAGANGASAVGGAIEAAGMQLTVASTLIATNSRPNCAGAVGDGGHNLDFPAFDASCPGSHGDPLLGALAANGGPTQTMALQAGSAAIDQVPAGGNCSPLDQRGVARPQPAGGACDIGAYEYAPPSCAGVNVSTAHATPVTIHLSCGDLTGATVIYALDTGTAHGTLSGLDPATGTVSYVPGGGFSGVDAFAYHAANGNGNAASQTATITVAGPPPPRKPPPPAPALSHLKISPRAFFDTAKRRGSRRRRKTGSTVSYRDTEAALTSFTVLAPRSGIISRAGCAKPPRHRPKHARRCTRYVAVARFRHTDGTALNRLHFSGVFGRHPLAVGAYRLQAQPAVGHLRGRAQTVSFQIQR